MNTIYVFGHKKPDTDSVCGSIALSYLKNQMGLKTEPRILSEINLETAYVLNKFNVPIPKYLNDVKIQIRDVKYKKNYFINREESIYKTYKYMKEKEITGLPIVDNKKIFTGYVSLREIAKELIISSTTVINTSFDNISATLKAKEIYRHNNFINGRVIVSDYNLLNQNDFKNLIIVGANQNKILKHLIKNEAKLIILTKNRILTENEKELINNYNANVIITPFDLNKVIKTIDLSNPIKSIQRGSSAITIEPNDYLTDFIDLSNKYKHTNYPVVNSRGICEGMLRVIDTNEYTKKNVILVDHNDPSQSVDGLTEANIIEIVDHHNIGNISTTSPINFRNMSVGSVSTVVYHLFLEQNIEIPKTIAALMLSGILSDTLLFASPTTTKIDVEVAKKLSKISNINIKEYGLKLLKSGVSIAGLTEEDVIYKDFKNYVAGEHKVGVAQVFTTSFLEYKNNISNYIQTLNNISNNNNYKVVCLFITDILKNDSYLIYNESAQKYLEDAYGINNLTQGYLLKGVVSRKKQMVPLILDVIEKV